MKIPVGDVLRVFVKGGWLRKILDALKGTKITTPGGTEILLDQDQGVPPLRGSKFDSTPHKIEPPRVGGRIGLTLAFLLLGGLTACEKDSPSAPSAPEAPAAVAEYKVPEGFKLVPEAWECKAPPVPCEGANCTPTPKPSPSPCVEGAPKVTTSVEHGPWGACALVGDTWLKSRTVTTTTTTTYACKAATVEVDRRTEWERCLPERVAFCHVSNKGNDRDNNVQEQQMFAEGAIPPGHVDHFSDPKFCPPDYVGMCDGRSLKVQCK